MNFYVKSYRGILPETTEYPCLVLVTNNWNDYGWQTLFTLYYYPTANAREEIGTVKILDAKTTKTELRVDFIKLPPHQCSLGQSLDYYTNLKRILPRDYRQVLVRLNDAATDEKNRNKFIERDGFRTSLLRSSEAEKVMLEAQGLLESPLAPRPSNFNFIYSVRLDNADEKHTIDFNFLNQIDAIFRTIVLIGKNGTGKTQVLKHLAASLCDSKSTGIFSPSRPLFSRVIAISFSLFDKFKVPKTTREFSYKYIGFRQGDEILDDEQLDNRLRQAFLLIKKQKRQNQWLGFISEIIEHGYFGFETKSTERTAETFEEIISRRDELLSSGQSILIFIITELIANLRKDSIVLFDEPETHLHPNAIARFVKLINSILQVYDSYSIIATHSPIVVQETPSRNVRLPDRIGNTPIVKNLPEESFGENLSKITDSIFYRNQVKEAYKEFFDEKIKELSLTDINERFNNGLSFNALLYLNAINDKGLND